MQIISILSLLLCFFPLFFYKKLNTFLNKNISLLLLGVIQLTYFVSTRLFTDIVEGYNIMYADVCSFFNILLPFSIFLKNNRFQISVANWAFVGGLTTFIFFIIQGNFYNLDGTPYYSIFEGMFVKFLDPPGTPGSWLMHWFLVFNSIIVLIKNYKEISFKNVYYSSLLISYFLLYLEVNRNIFEKNGNISALSEYEWSELGQYYIEKNLTPITDLIRELNYVWKILISYVLFFSVSFIYLLMGILMKRNDKRKKRFII